MKYLSKKSFVLCPFFFGLLCSTSCSKTITNNSSFQWYTYPEFSEYYQLPHSMGEPLQLFFWKINDEEFRCGITQGKEHNIKNFLMFHHLQYCIPCPLNIMKEIMATYPPYTFAEDNVWEIPYPCTDSGYIKDSIYKSYICEYFEIPHQGEINI